MAESTNPDLAAFRDDLAALKQPIWSNISKAERRIKCAARQSKLIARPADFVVKRPAFGSGGNAMLGEALSLFKQHKALGLLAALLTVVVVIGGEGWARHE